ncbi:hypothetical protein KR026_011054 [Drosophila bipectinata]|nr:hypothetical protein KR026_011054 [Drosophila bipectinata]
MNRIDLTMDDMANTKFLTLYNSLFKTLASSTDFNYNEVVSLLTVFYKFTLHNGTREMSTRQMYNLCLVMFDIFDVQIIDRISMNITSDGRFISPEAWMKVFGVFLNGNLEERMRFAFNVYTSAGTVFLNREVVGFAIEKFFYGDDDDEVNELRADMVEFIFGKFDHDKDGVISFDEYAAVVSKQPGLLEFLGKIYPDNRDKALIAYCHNIESLFPSED